MDMKLIVSPDDVDTLQLPWGTFQWLNEPNVTGSKRMTAGIGLIAPGQGHAKHNHPGIEEIIFFLEGEAEQTVWHADGKTEVKTVKPGMLVSLPTGAFHSTMNKGTQNVRFLAVYEFSGPEVGMREYPECKIVPAKNR